MERATRFTVTDSEGTTRQWAFYRDGRTPQMWMLRDHTGYLRTLEKTWNDSVVRIQAIAANHGFTTNVS